MKAVPKEQLPLVQGLMTQLPGILATTTDVNATLYLVKQK